MLPTLLQDDLATEAEKIIPDVLSRGGPRSGHAPSGEVSAVKAMTLDGFDRLEQAWSPILRKAGYRMETYAVFCHSRPHVKFRRPRKRLTPAHISAKTKGRCELADLLVVMDHVDVAGRTDRRAVLIQAKLLKTGRLKLQQTEWIQHELLASLPKFTFIDADYDPRPRELKGSAAYGDPLFTAEYGGIELQQAARSWSQSVPIQTQPGFKMEEGFSKYLAGMATGEDPFGRDAVPGGKDDWSFTVDELLEVTGSKPIVKRDSKISRLNQNTVGFIVDTSAVVQPPSEASGGGSGAEVTLEDKDRPDGPISTVHMIFSHVESVDHRQ